MKRIFLFTLLCLYFSAHSQSYKPFPSQGNYIFGAHSGQDSVLITLSIDSTYYDNGDSVFVFNRVVHKDKILGDEVYYYAKDNVFGKEVRQKSNGDLIFHCSNGDSMLLKTTVVVGSSWSFDGSVTADLASRNLESTIGGMDTVLTYHLGNGQVIKLSQNFGLVQSQTWIQRDLEAGPDNLIYNLVGSQGLGIGRDIAQFEAFFSYSNGAYFQYWLPGYLGLVTGRTDDWHIQNRLSLGDSLDFYYQRTRERLDVDLNNYYYTPPYQDTLIFSHSDYGFLNLLSGQGDSTAILQTITVDPVTNRWVQHYENRPFFWSANLQAYIQLSGPLRNFVEWRYMEEVGLVEKLTQYPSAPTTIYLTCYNIGNGQEQWSNHPCVDLGIYTGVLPVNRLEAIEVFPNPSSSVCWLKFPQEYRSKIRFKVYSSNGTVIREASFATAKSAIQIDVQDWPSGIYLLEIQDEEGGRCVKKILIE